MLFFSPPMKLALNGATTMRADLVTDCRAAKAAGFDYVEIWAAKLRDFLKQRSTSELKDLFSPSGPRPLSINSIEHITFRDARAYESIKQECDELSSIAAAIGCPCIVVVPGRLPDGGASRETVIEESVRVLNELCDISGRYGVSLAFEFLGQTDCSVQTLGLAADVVREAGRQNLGLVIDSFHFYAGGSTLDMIEALDPKLIQIFHINDAEDLPRDQLEDRHRLLPGLGILPLREIVSAFRRIGYDKVASVEIFRPEYWERDPFELAREARAATERVLSHKEAQEAQK
jgi:2-keto-myo-inositol isomerase